jgi:hypothetical protein
LSKQAAEITDQGAQNNFAIVTHHTEGMPDE